MTICDNYTLTHMSGKTQTKQEFIDEIMDGTLNYYKSTINNPDIKVCGENKSIFKADVTLDAKVYGIKGTWTLHSQQTLEKINNKWYISKWIIKMSIDEIIWWSWKNMHVKKL